MDNNLKRRAIEYANHFSIMTDIHCTVVDLAERTQPNDMGEERIPICRLCSQKDCRGSRDFARGCEEAYQMDGLYIYYCPQDLLLICAAVLDEKGTLAGGMVLGPVILNNKQDLLSRIHSPAFQEALEELSDLTPLRIQSMAEILAAVSCNTSRLSNKKTEQYFYRKDSLLHASYVEQMKKEQANDYYAYPIVMEGKLRMAIRNRDKEMSQMILNQMLSYIYYFNNGDLESIKPQISGLVLIISRAAADAGANVRDIFLINESFNANVEHFKNVEELSVWVSEMLQRFISLTFEFEQLKHADTVYKVIDFIKNNYHRHITLEELSSATYISKTYLSTLFKKETGYSIWEYINDVRVNRAQSLLANSDLSIVEISRMCGFEDQSYFTKVFRKIAGITPKKYRENYGVKSRLKVI